MRVLGYASYRYRWAVLVFSLLLAAGGAVYGSGVFDRTQPFGFSDPDSESARAYDLLEEQTGERAVPELLLVVRPRRPPGSAAGHAELERVARQLEAVAGVARAVPPEDRRAAISEDGTLGLVGGFLDVSVDDPSEVGERVEQRFEGRGRVEVGGIAVAAHQLNQTTAEDLRSIELYAAPLLLLISFFVFRGLVAAMLPLLVGGLSIVFTLAALRALSELLVIDVFALNVVTVLGLGLAIDYSLFMVSRFREELGGSATTGGALADTLAPVGRMICFSAAIVASAVAALAVFPQRFLYSTGIGCALVALISAAVVLLVLPSVLAVLGERVNGLSPATLQRPITHSRRWRGLARMVLARPLPVATGVAAAMLIAGLPFLRVELTRADARVLSEDHSARLVDSVIRKRFPVDPSATILIVLPQGSEEMGGVKARARGFAATTGIAAVSKPVAVGDAIVVSGETEASPYSDQAIGLVRSARSLHWGGPVLVTGGTAELLDQRRSLEQHLPAALAIVLGATMLALLLMTGSLLLPLLAVICNTLTVSVAFGVLVLVFQDGHLESALDYIGVGALDTSVPILLFAVVFGLSTDYGVFLTSRIAEAREQGEGDAEAIGVGLERTGRIITAAALLFAVAMGAFVFSEMIFIKEVAVGTSVAVLVDAALVRTLLLPALMRLCGRWTWWAPRPLRALQSVRA
jgi:uncharacterized membrane protein YdfJ with MMPL/SSD domain